MNDGSETDDHGVKRRKIGSGSKPGRRKAACQTCRLRKVKCDNVRPECSLCRTSGSDCHYSEDTTEALTLEKVVQLIAGRFDGVSQQLETLQASTASLSAVRYGSSMNETAAPSMAPSYLPSPQIIDQTRPRPSRNFSEIPPHRTTCDTVLTWPIFESAFPPNYFIEQHLGHSPTGRLSHTDLSPGSEIYEQFAGLAPLDEDRIPFLVDNFLENVHTKNPILDVEQLVKLSREHAHRGLTWDAWSCLILLACALGSIAKPFGSEVDALDYEMPLETARQISCPVKERQQAENCYVQACRRFGLLKPTILSAQCHFFAGVYLMYTLRPMLSWQHFHQASIAYQLYLKMSGRLSDDNCILDVNDNGTDLVTDLGKKRLEQRLYWSCFKSECEFRVELPLPQSEIATYEYPNLFPSPPSPVVMEQLHDDPQTSPVNSSQPQRLSHHSQMEEIDDIKLHAKKLCNEEESWYYYLTEVALRRIGNRIINTFFRHEPREWLKIEPFLDLAIEFETQVSSWWANLPPAMQKYETNSTIRAPRAASPGGALAGFVTQELSWATENRLLEMRSWLYQPFIYYLVHVRPTRPGSVAADGLTSTQLEYSPHSLSPELKPIFWDLIARAIDCNLTILDTRSVPHRHHGLWYDLRAIVCATLVLLAVVKSGYEHLIPGGRTNLLGDWYFNKTSHPGSRQEPVLSNPIQGKFGKVLRQLEIWSQESADMQRHKDVLTSLIHASFDIR